MQDLLVKITNVTLVITDSLSPAAQQLSYSERPWTWSQLWVGAGQEQRQPWPWFTQQMLNKHLGQNSNCFRGVTAFKCLFGARQDSKCFTQLSVIPMLPLKKPMSRTGVNEQKQQRANRIWTQPPPYTSCLLRRLYSHMLYCYRAQISS